MTTPTPEEVEKAKYWFTSVRQWNGYPCGLCADGSEPSVESLNATSDSDVQSLATLLAEVRAEGRISAFEEAIDETMGCENCAAGVKALADLERKKQEGTGGEMKFRKKSFDIDALRWNATGKRWKEMNEFCKGGAIAVAGKVLVIETLEGQMLAQPGDWIVKGVKGEFYPVKPDIFAASYYWLDDGMLRPVPDEH